MTKEEQEEIEDMIDSAIKSSEESISAYREETKPISPDDAIGRVSRMDAINNKSVVEAALRTQENKLRGLIRVKSELGTEDFGRCKKCKKTIPIQRILLVPHNRFCVNCAQ